MGLTLQTSPRNACCNALVDLLDVGSGTATMTITESDDTVLSTHNLLDPAFGAAATGVSTANAIADATAGATGTAAKCRWYDKDSALVFEGTVSTSAADINLDSVAISSGVTVSIEGGDGGGTITMPAI